MRVLSSAMYLVLSIIGLSCVGFLALVGVQYARGMINLGDLRSMMRIIGGNYRVVIPSDQYERFVAFSKDEEAARAELEGNRGLPETRVPAALRAQAAEAAQRDNLEVLNRLLAAEQQKVAEILSQVEAHKGAVAGLQRALDDERRKNAIVDADAATQKLRKTLSEMDAADIATFLSQVVLDPSQGGPAEAARIVRDHLKADFSAEVLAEMQPQERQRIIPLLENRFAGVPPEAVVKIFADDRMGPGEQLAYMMQMNTQQALGVYLRLPPDVQERIAPQVMRGL